MDTREQFPLPGRRRQPRSLLSGRARLAVEEESAAKVTVRDGDREIVLDRKRARITKIVDGGSVRIESGPVLNLWRAPTDNDGIKLVPRDPRKALGKWLEAGLDRLKPEGASLRINSVSKRRVVLITETSGRSIGRQLTESSIRASALGLKPMRWATARRVFVPTGMAIGPV